MTTNTCRHCRRKIWLTGGAPRWTDRIDDTAILGSGLVCPVNYRHEPEEN